MSYLSLYSILPLYFLHSKPKTWQKTWNPKPGTQKMLDRWKGRRKKKEVLFLKKRPFVFFLQKCFIFLKSGGSVFPLSIRVCALEHLTLAKGPNSISNQLRHFQFLCGSFMLFPFMDTLTFHGEWVPVQLAAPLSPTPLSCPHFTSSQLPASWGALSSSPHSWRSVCLLLAYLSFDN